EVGQALGEGTALGAGVLRRQLGGDEHVRPGDPAVPQCPADLGLVAVDGRRVQVPVTGRQGLPHRVVAAAPAQLPGAEAEQGHVGAAAQRYRRSHAPILAQWGTARCPIWPKPTAWPRGTRTGRAAGSRWTGTWSGPCSGCWTWTPV